MATLLNVIKPGLFSTIQDGGRIGYRRFGIPRSGYMDEYSANIANWLVGNEQNAPVIEMIQVGAEIEFNTSCTVALSGADMLAKIGTRLVPLNTQIKVAAGERLTLSKAERGNICYLAIAGKFLMEAVLGSLSTYQPAQIGGYLGRKLSKGDELPIIVNDDVPYRLLPEHLIHLHHQGRKIRLLQNQENETLLPSFCDQAYTIAPQSDRMGIRLVGKPIGTQLTSIISSPISRGCIQLPSGGNPIVSMADGQTTGGYPIIGTIIQSDIGYLAQQPIGATIQFTAIDYDEAMALLKYESDIMHHLFGEKA